MDDIGRTEAEAGVEGTMRTQGNLQDGRPLTVNLGIRMGGIFERTTISPIWYSGRLVSWQQHESVANGTHAAYDVGHEAGADAWRQLLMALRAAPSDGASQSSWKLLTPIPLRRNG